MGFSDFDLTLTFVKKLQTMAVAFLKKWSGLPRCANTAILFVGDQRRPGLKVHNLCTFWKQQQGVKFELLRKSLGRPSLQEVARHHPSSPRKMETEVRTSR